MTSFVKPREPHAGWGLFDLDGVSTHESPREECTLQRFASEDALVEDIFRRIPSLATPTKSCLEDCALCMS